MTKSQIGIVTLSEVETDKKTKTILLEMNEHMRESGEATSEFYIGKVSFNHLLLPENNLRDFFVALKEDLKNSGIELQTAPIPEISDFFSKLSVQSKNESND
ncbi:hypothetical protein ACK6F9_002392 [Escherichia coli]